MRSRTCTPRRSFSTPSSCASARRNRGPFSSTSRPCGAISPGARATHTRASGGARLRHPPRMAGPHLPLRPKRLPLHEEDRGSGQGGERQPLRARRRRGGRTGVPPHQHRQGPRRARLDAAAGRCRSYPRPVPFRPLLARSSPCARRVAPGPDPFAQRREPNRLLRSATTRAAAARAVHVLRGKIQSPPTAWIVAPQPDRSRARAARYPRLLRAPPYPPAPRGDRACRPDRGCIRVHPISRENRKFITENLQEFRASMNPRVGTLCSDRMRVRGRDRGGR